MGYKFKSKKPYVVYTKDGDYFFNNKEEAQSFAKARNGFFDKTIYQFADQQRQRRLKGVM